MRVHRAWKHALEFEPLDIEVQAVRIRFNFRGRTEIPFAGGKLEQLARIGDGARQPIEAADDVFKPGPFPAEFLRPVGLVPDARLFEFARDFLKSLVLIVVIKDTPSKSRYAPRDL
jgi:hypothetical protein